MNTLYKPAGEEILYLDHLKDLLTWPGAIEAQVTTLGSTFVPRPAFLVSP